MKKIIVLFIALLLLIPACAETTTPAPEATSTAAPTSTPTLPDILPQSLYYLAADANDMQQIFRLERDGQTVKQITSEAGGVDNFDLSPADGRILYYAANTILITDANGENPQIVEADLLDASRPIWSPDGTKVAYKVEKVAVLYHLETGEKESLFVDAENEVSWFSSFSPDGSKIALRKYTTPSAPGGSVYVYDFTQQASIEFPQGKRCYNDAVRWASPDTLFCYGHNVAGGAMPGLFRMNALDGSVETLIFSETLPPFLMVDAPRQDAAGNLIYFYAEITDTAMLPPAVSVEFNLVHSAVDGVTDRVNLREEIFTHTYSTWTPNSEALLTEEDNQLLLVPVDPTLPIITIMDDTSNIEIYSLEWGP